MVNASVGIPNESMFERPKPTYTKPSTFYGKFSFSSCMSDFQSSISFQTMYNVLKVIQNTSFLFRYFREVFVKRQKK